MRALLTLLLTSTLALPALAQRPADRSGFSLGIRAYYAEMSTAFQDQEGSVSGIGAEVEAAFSITPSVIVFLNLGGADVSTDRSEFTEGVGAADLGIRLNAFPSQALTPYVQGAVSGQAYIVSAVGSDASLNLTGMSGMVGAGLQYEVTPGLSLDAGADASVGTFDTISAEGESAEIDPRLDTRTLRVGGGLVYVF